MLIDRKSGGHLGEKVVDPFSDVMTTRDGFDIEVEFLTGNELRRAEIAANLRRITEQRYPGLYYSDISDPAKHRET